MTTQARPAPTPDGNARDPAAPAAAPAVSGEARPTEAARPKRETGVPDVVKAACRLAAARGRPAAVFILAEGDAAKGTPDVPITLRTVNHLATALGEASGFEKLDLVIQSSGGDIHAAYKMMSFLRRRMADDGELTACVPRKAQSSATLLCLGADMIVLDELAALGPLDAQIRHGITDVGTPDYQSALHMLKALTQLRDFSLETLTQAAAALYDKDVRRSDDIIRYAIEFSRGITTPLFERIESHKIGYWEQMQRTGEDYGQRLLELGHGHLLQEPAAGDERPDVKHIIHALVNDYPSHEYVIDCEELVGRLHLRAALFEGHERATARELAKCFSDTLIMMVYPPEFASGTETAAATDATDNNWNAPGTEGSAQAIRWDGGDGGTFLMRVARYHRPLKSSRNPWRERGPSPDGAPSEQYSAFNVGPGWARGDPTMP